MSEIADYIMNLCRQQHLSMREASIKAGLSTETVGVIVRRGNPPRPDTLRAIARALGGDYDHMMRISGHLPPRPPSDEEFIDSDMDDLVPLWKEIKYRNRKAYKLLLDATRSMAQTVLATLWIDTANRDE